MQRKVFGFVLTLQRFDPEAEPVGLVSGTGSRPAVPDDVPECKHVAFAAAATALGAA